VQPFLTAGKNSNFELQLTPCPLKGYRLNINRNWPDFNFHRKIKSPLDGVLAASYDDSKEDSLWNCGVYCGGWRRELHPTAKGR